MSLCCLSVAQAPLATTREGETEGDLRVYMSKSTSAKSNYVFIEKSRQKSAQTAVDKTEFKAIDSIMVF